MTYKYSAKILAAAFTLAWPTLCFGHAQLTSAVPAVGSFVKLSPTEIRLTFTEAIEVKLSKVDLMNETDMIDDIASVSLDPNDKKTLVAKLKSPLPQGSYMVMWHVVSVDTHKTQGDFSFAIQP